MPQFSPHDLRQMDQDWQDAQPESVVRQLLKRGLEDLRAANDRLARNPGNSSRPPGSMPSWERSAMARATDQQFKEAAQDPGDGCAGEADAGPQSAPQAAAGAMSAPHTDAPEATARVPASGRSGRKPGAPGHGRMQKLEPTHTHRKHPSHCAACQRPLTPGDTSQAWTGWDTLELLPLSECEGATGELGLRVQVTRHLLMQQDCPCGHMTRAHASAMDAGPDWPGVKISEQRLLGPRLAASVVYLCVRMRLPRRKVQELLMELLGLSVSVAVIDQTLQQAARSLAPLEEQISRELEQAAQVYVDETSWPEARQSLWLWVLCCSHCVLYVIGSRAREMLDNALSTDFAGTLMSDGYGVYRERRRRLRCWAHLKRKLRGLCESSDGAAARAGTALLDVLQGLMDAVYVAREQMQAWRERCDAGLARPDPPSVTHAHLIRKMFQLCEADRDAPHPQLRAVAREFLNDWEAIMRVLDEPEMSLTNNAAERQLRHWVIARRISYGTRTLAGSNSFAVLASVIDTCRLRGASITQTVAGAIHAARQGLKPPALPPVPAHLLEPQEVPLAA
jgi:transposase